MNTDQDVKDDQMKVTTDRIPESELSTLSQILNALDIKEAGQKDLRDEDESHMRIVCWDKPAEEINQALAQMSRRYQDALKS